jgi:hypothetical protein
MQNMVGTLARIIVSILFSTRWRRFLMMTMASSVPPVAWTLTRGEAHIRPITHLDPHFRKFRSFFNVGHPQ